MLAPKKVKWRKMQKGRRRGTAWRGATLAFGDYGLQALERGWMSAREIEAARVALTRAIKRGGRVWVRVFPDKPLTKKPAETRMGKGKGSPESWVAVVKLGRKPDPRAPCRAGRRHGGMKAAELREMGLEELRAKERELVEELFHLRLRRATSQLPKPMKVRSTRRELARVKTVLRERTHGGGAG